MYEIEKDVYYGHDLNVKQVADVYHPKKGGNHPVVLFIHGGGWKAGSKEMFQEYGPYFARNGFFAISIDYRLSTPEKSTWPKVMNDINQALEWIVEEASFKWDIDVNNICIIGESCGAQLAVLLSLENRFKNRIRAIVGIYGVYNIEDWWKYTRETREDNPVGDFIGGSPDEFSNDYANSSPSERLKNPLPKNFKNIPFLLIWGEQDDVVPSIQSHEFAQQLQALEIETETFVLPDMGHYWFSVLPWLDGGDLADYPNNIVAPKLLSYLEKKLVEQNIIDF